VFNVPATQGSSAAETTGTPIPLSYGYVWATGKRHAYYAFPGSKPTWYTRAGAWLLGHGEWDGCIELWINDQLTWRGDTTIVSRWNGWDWLQTVDFPNYEDIVFHFHSGTDATIGAGLAPVSTGPDQGVDTLWSVFPPAIQPLAFNRVAYYMLMRDQPVESQTSTHQDDPNQWTDINPIGLWRALKCRLFDATGNMIGYAFTTNPVWHWVDIRLRRKLFVEYNLSLTNGPDNLPAAVRACFDWNKIYTSAQYCDEILANGRRRFEGSYSFTSKTSLQAIEAQIAQVCRGYYSSYGGKYALNIDMPRSSVFTFRRDNILPGTFSADDQQSHTAANRYIAQFRDLLIPQAAVIASITNTSNGNPEVTTEEPHPFNAGDFIAIGGTDTTYDGEWQVYSVPDVINAGLPTEIDPTTLVLQSKGSNYPTSVGSGGSMGLLYSRFALRTPLFRHEANELARGALALGVPRQHNGLKTTLDLATSTYDQASRIARYERDRMLGIDTTGTDGQLDAPYVTPPFVKLSTSMFAQDPVGNLACAIEPGDRVTVDPTLSPTYAGDYEVLDPKKVKLPAVQVTAQGGSLQFSPANESGEIEFALGPYNESIFYDDSDSLAAGYPSVPGSDPGNETDYTAIPLAGGGDLVFFTGIGDNGSQFQLPSTGFPSANMLAWASAAGALIQYHSAQAIDLCYASSTRQLTLTYDDTEGHTWGGSVGYGACAWLGAGAIAATVGVLDWAEFTLLGGEIVAFGQGILADGYIITDADLPAGFDVSKMFALAFIHQIPGDGHGDVMHSAGANVDTANTVHVDMSDGSSHTWHGNATVLLFCWQNNMGTITTETVSGASWIECVLSNGMKFGAGVSKAVANGSSFGIPSAAGAATTLQVIAGSSYGLAIAGSNHAQGIGSCYVDADNIVHIEFQDGSGDQWYGTADVFGLYCESGLGTPTIVTVTPPSATVNAGNFLGFAATVTGNANPNVTWKVDGIAGGNLTVGTISSAGFYAAPNASGTHTITATSVGDPTASANATVTVYGDVLTGTVLTDDSGDVIYTDSGDTITD
jgi:hypothetical protein